MTPPECVTTELKFDSHCVFECPKGYLFEGTRDKSTFRFCQTDGTWTGEHKPCVGKLIEIQMQSANMHLLVSYEVGFVEFNKVKRFK